MKIWKQTLLFYIGGMTYVGIELLWRGFSHWSMFLLGGLCFILIGGLGRVQRPLPIPLRVIAAALIVTMLELGCGLLVNRDFQVWDYRALPFNYHGQICLPFTLLWMPVCLFAIVVYDRLENAVTKLCSY